MSKKQIKVVPSDVNSEQIVLDWLTNHPHDINIAMKVLKKEDFYRENNAEAYDKIRKEHYEGISKFNHALKVIKELSDRRKKIQELTEGLEELFDGQQ